MTVHSTRRGLIAGAAATAALAASLPFVANFPPLLVRFIGLSELAGAVGLLLPAATRIAPALTPLAGVWRPVEAGREVN